MSVPMIFSIVEKYSCVKRVKIFVGKYSDMLHEHLIIVLYLNDSDRCVDESEEIENEILSLDNRVIVYSVFE